MSAETETETSLSLSSRQRQGRGPAEARHISAREPEARRIARGTWAADPVPPPPSGSVKRFFRGKPKSCKGKDIFGPFLVHKPSDLSPPPLLKPASAPYPPPPPRAWKSHAPLPSSPTPPPVARQVLPVYPSSLLTATNLALDDNVTQCGLVLAAADPGTQSFEQQEQTMLLSLTLGAENSPATDTQQLLADSLTVSLTDEAQRAVPVVSGIGNRVDLALNCPGCAAPRCGCACDPRGGWPVMY